MAGCSTPALYRMLPGAIQLFPANIICVIFEQSLVYVNKHVLVCAYEQQHCSNSITIYLYIYMSVFMPCYDKVNVKAKFWVLNASLNGSAYQHCTPVVNFRSGVILLTIYNAWFIFVLTVLDFGCYSCCMLFCMSLKAIVGVQLSWGGGEGGGGDFIFYFF